MICSDCGADKPRHRFATFRTRKGELRRRGVCYECRSKYAFENFEKLQKWRREYNQWNRPKKRKRDSTRRTIGKAFVDALKSQPCADCGRRFPPVAMDLDHVHGAKVYDVARLVGSAYSLELIVLEARKCEVVCACCHRIRTAKRGENRAPNQRRKRTTH